MPAAVVDSNVVFAFRMERDRYHDRGRAIVRGMDDGRLPEGQVTNYALPEILNPIGKRAGHARAVETLDFLTESAGFAIRHLDPEDLSRGRALYRRNDGVELPDAVTVAYMRRRGLDYVYSFDDDFDRFDGVTRFSTASNPFEPGDG